MKMELEQQEGVRIRPVLRLTHGDRTLDWDVYECAGDIQRPELELYRQINAYWSTLPSLSQEKLFGLYEKIREIFEYVKDTVELIRHLQPLVRQIYEYHSYSAIADWMAFHGHKHGVIIPTRFVQIYVFSEDKPGDNREKTYTREDYIDLMGLALALRPMLPIWGEFLLIAKKEIGTNFKEDYAFSLLNQTRIPTCTAVEKIMTYAEQQIPSDRALAAEAAGGIGGDDYIRWLMKLLVVNRISSGDIRGIENYDTAMVTGDKCLVVKLYGYIRQQVEPRQAGSFGGAIRNKDFEKEEKATEKSRIESSSISSQNAQGDLLKHDAMLHGDCIERIVTKISGYADSALCELAKTAYNDMMRSEIEDCQITLTAWVTAPTLSPRSFDHVRKESLVKSLLIAQVVLWQAGYKILALLITAKSTKNYDAMQCSSTGSMTRVKKEQMDELDRLYPDKKIPRSKPNTKVVNEGYVAIDIVANQLAACDWVLQAPDELIKQVISNGNRKIGCPHDIREILADLVIKTESARREAYENKSKKI
jgi:hypothetical protein